MRRLLLCAATVAFFSHAAVANEIEARNIAEEARTLIVKTSAPRDNTHIGIDNPTRTTNAATVSQGAALSLADSGPASPPETDQAVPEAKSVDLAEPISTEDLNAVEEPPHTEPPAIGRPSAGEGAAATKTAAEAGVPADDATPKQTPKPTADQTPQTELSANIPAADTLLILGTKVPPSTSTRLAWSPSLSFEGLSMPTPVLVVNGAKNGPTLCLTAAVHGDELNGIEIVRRVLYSLDPQEVSGAVIGVPIVNLQGFRRNSRYLADRRDLNRYFPGNDTGSSASRIAHSFFNSVISHCDALVDLHTGSFDRTNLPQLRADLRDKDIAKLTHNFGATVVLHSTGAEGTLRRAAAENGIPAVTLEAGGPNRLQESIVSHGVAGVQTLLNSMGMIKKFSFWGKPEPVYYQSSWIRVNHGGILFSKARLGEKISAGDVLGTVTDPITNVSHDVVSPHQGRILGMALNQVMLPGFAAYHIGIAAKDETKAVPADDTETSQPLDADLSQADKVLNEEPGSTADLPTSKATTPSSIESE
ncbi:succinylglutamate desuccinylase/aspartoacylase family protein [Pseudomaricurvus hydrocarbonicus]|uniref:succinylglutamate desuccinylase/aspartoacylase family protein n=1 Tax=Pseudomaricurvus hydrocarbonicus TaxID=1470433 RepID=UPI001AA075B5|nr:succinylglutamate desuccinylase/aspartoacylase family protein [Aestuariicella hydrocarbonica]